MPKKPQSPQKFQEDVVDGRDLFSTPRYAVELLVPFLPDIHTLNLVVWECACGDHHITKVLRECGYNVVESDLKYAPEQNFLTHKTPPRLPYVVVTNPPFSAKNQFLNRCIELDVPFALLIPISYSKAVIDAIRFHGCQRITPTKRIDYITPTGLSGANGHTSYFHSFWLTRYLNIPKEMNEVFVELTTEMKKRIF